MIESLLSGSYSEIRLTHVRMAFSRRPSEVGRASPKKLLHLLAVVLAIVYKKLRAGATVLYYPPSGPALVPVCRDIAILVCTRWMFRHTVFHFHASGLSQLYGRLPSFLRWLFRLAYYYPDLAIRLSLDSPDDPRAIRAKAERVIPNGIPDRAGARQAWRKSSGDQLLVLFAGTLRESKGVLVLLRALAQLREGGIPVQLEAIGEFISSEFQRRFLRQVRDLGLERHVSVPGLLLSDAKDNAFRRADVFCLPTFFESETFPVVLLEAMQFSLPVVATKWRGIPSIVHDGGTGLLVAPRDVKELVESLALLLTDSELRARMGKMGRQVYVERFTVELYRSRMEAALAFVGRPTLVEKALVLPKEAIGAKGPPHS